MRYRHLRRTVIAVLAAVAFVLTLVMIARHVLESALIRSAAVHMIERAAANRGFDLAIADLHWEMLPPRAVMKQVTLTGPGLSAEIDHLEADLARIRVARRTIELGTVAAAGITVRLEEMPETQPRRGKSLVRLAIRHLDLRDINFEAVSYTHLRAHET